MLTTLTLDKAKPRQNEYTLWDNAIPNFGVRIKPSGVKSYVLVHRIAGKKTRQTLGRYPSKSLQDARKEALALLTLPTPQNRSCEVVQALEAYRTHYLPTIGARTSVEWDRILTKHFSTLPNLEQLSARDVYSIVERLPPSAANHAIVALKRFLKWLKQTGRLHNTLDLTKPNKEKSRDRVLSLEEICRLWTATSTPTIYNCIVRLLILTAQRRGEIATTHKCLLTEQDITWPTTKNGKPHTIPLSATAALTLQTLLSTSTNTHAKPLHNTWGKTKIALDKSSGVTNYTLHDIRRSVATHMAEQLKVQNASSPTLTVSLPLWRWNPPSLPRLR